MPDTRDPGMRWHPPLRKAQCTATVLVTYKAGDFVVQGATGRSALVQGPPGAHSGPSVQREALDPVTTCSTHSADEASGQAQAEGRGRPHPRWPLRAGNSPVTPQWPVLAGPPAARPASPLRQAPHAPRSPSCTTHPCKPGAGSPPRRPPRPRGTRSRLPWWGHPGGHPPVTSLPTRQLV